MNFPKTLLDPPAGSPPNTGPSPNSAKEVPLVDETLAAWLEKMQTTRDWINGIALAVGVTVMLLVPIVAYWYFYGDGQPINWSTFPLLVVGCLFFAPAVGSLALTRISKPVQRRVHARLNERIAFLRKSTYRQDGAPGEEFEIASKAMLLPVYMRRTCSDFWSRSVGPDRWLVYRLKLSQKWRYGPRFDGVLLSVACEMPLTGTTLIVHKNQPDDFAESFANQARRLIGGGLKRVVIYNDRFSNRFEVLSDDSRVARAIVSAEFVELWILYNEMLAPSRLRLLIYPGGFMITQNGRALLETGRVRSGGDFALMQRTMRELDHLEGLGTSVMLECWEVKERLSTDTALAPPLSQ
jgi:Protein of unknown function (DUF3137)